MPVAQGSLFLLDLLEKKNCLSMPNYLVLEFYLLLLLISVDGEGEEWNRLLHGGSVEDEGDNVDVNIFIDMTTWRLLFPDGGIKAEMM
jgi:hypothetical protein